MLLFLSMGLILADAVVTRRGLSRGFPEVNPILRYFLERYGLAGLAMTRVAAFMLMLILFWILEPWEWILFSVIFSAVMGYVVLVGAWKVIAPRADHAARTPSSSTNRD